MVQYKGLVVTLTCLVLLGAVVWQENLPTSQILERYSSRVSSCIHTAFVRFTTPTDSIPTPSPAALSSSSSASASEQCDPESAMLALQRNDKATARQHLRRCKDLGPRLEYAFLLMNDGEIEHAIRIASDLSIAYDAEPRAHSALAELYLAGGDPDAAVNSLHTALSRLFGVSDWRADGVLSALSTERALAGTPLLRLLASTCEGVRQLPCVINALDVLTVLQPSDAQLHGWLSEVYRSTGEVAQSLFHNLYALALRLHEQVRHELIDVYPPDQPYIFHPGQSDPVSQYVMQHALLLLSTSFEASVVSTGRQLISFSSHRQQMLALFRSHCALDPALYAEVLQQREQVSRTFLVKLLVQCMYPSDAQTNNAAVVGEEDDGVQVGGSIHEKGILEDLVATDADSVRVSNLFGWTPLHHAAALGDIGLIRRLLLLPASLHASTVTGLTPLHVAAMRANLPAVRELVQGGARIDLLDDYGRSPWHLACAHRYAHNELRPLLTSSSSTQDAPVDAYCERMSQPLRLSSAVVDSSTTAVPNEEKWLSPPSAPGRCDIDVVDADELTSQRFLAEYLSVERPVLIRGALLRDPRWRETYSLFTPQLMANQFADETVSVAGIPYAHAFGAPQLSTTLGAFFANERGFRSTELDPLYVFQSLAEDSPIRAYHHLPELFADPSLNITTRNVQFYVGPPHSGAPVHFHRHAWNGLLFGRKRWFLIPPRNSFYSTKHIHRWVREDHDELVAMTGLLECEQRSGDIMYVPDFWGHGVLNLDASVGFASEFLWGNTYFDL